MSFLFFLLTIFLNFNNDSNYIITTNNQNNVAIISLFAYNGKNESNYGLINLGHTFVSIENIADKNLLIYNYNLQPKECITISTWSIFKHFGIWFNIESNYINTYNKYKDRVSISLSISEEQINNLNTFLEDSDNWGLLRNCSYFSINLWNNISQENKINKPFFTNPSYLYKEIKKFTSYETNKSIKTCKTIGYIDNNNFIKYTLEGC